MYCPAWIYEICVARTAFDFLHSELGLTAFAVKYANGLSSLYETFETKKIEEPAETLLMFLSEIEAGEMAAEFLNNFSYNKLYYESANTKRKLKPLFGNLEDPIKTQEANQDTCIKNFKAFVFYSRSHIVETPPSSWRIETDENLPKLATIFDKEVNILDIF